MRQNPDIVSDVRILLDPPLGEPMVRSDGYRSVG